MLHWLMTVCMVPWEAMSVMVLWRVKRWRRRDMALVLVSSQVSHTHLLTVVSIILMFSCQ